MSGSGGGGSYGGGARQTTCEIVERVPLNSVKGNVLRSLRVYQELDVEVREQSLVATIDSGDVAGSLTPSRLAALLECIARGHEYKAVILKITGAFVEVEIRPK